MELSQKTRSGEITPDELHAQLSQIYYTKRLLRVFIANLKHTNKTSLLLLFELLERNVKNIPLAEEQEKAQWHRRREALRKINPKLDIRYRVDHLSREQIIQDECYVKIMSFILTRISGEHATLNNVSDFCARIVDFENKLDDSFMEALTSALDRIDTENINEQYMGSILSKGLLIMKKLRTHKVVTFKFIKPRVEKIDWMIKNKLDFSKLKYREAFSIYLHGHSLFMTNLHLLEPILLKNLDSMDITQLLLTFFVSSEIPQTSGEFQVALAFNISNKMPNARLEYLVKCYKLLTPINKKTGYQMISTPRKISAQATLLLKTALRESLPALTVSLKSKSVLRIDQLETILSYFEANKEETPSQPLLELLSLQLTKQDTFTNNEDFLRVYQLFSELDLKSLAMADHFNKTFYHLVQSDIEKSVLALRLEGKVQPDAPTEDSTLATYQRRAEDFALEYAFKRVLNYSWSFFKFSYRSGEMKYIDKSLLESMIKAVNMSVK